MKAHFAHNNAECVSAYYEPETDSHIKGKEILFDWIKKNYPKAEIQYEVYIPETKQIADVFVKHTEEKTAGVRWAFEFQHSPLSSADWEKRHELYQTEGIQDFWILDKAKYMKFSTAQGITDARVRRDLEKTIFRETGLCYFLDLETSELTIDFEFITTYESKIIKGRKRKTPYVYHSPILHSSHMDNIKIGTNKEFKCSVMSYKEIASQMNERLEWILQKLKKENELRLHQELMERALEKKKFAESKYGKETAEIIWRFIQNNQETLAEKIRNLPEDNFFEVYKGLIEKLLINITDYKSLKDSDELTKKLIRNLSYDENIYKIPFLVDQGSDSLDDYLKIKYQEKISLVEYAYVTHKDVLEKIASFNTKFVNDKLYSIKGFLKTYESNPTVNDYAIKYHHCKTTEEIDGYIEQISNKIINYNPFEDIDW